MIEQIAESIPGLKGKSKQDAVVELVKAALKSAEDATARNLANDAEVEAATRSVIDAVVALNNLLDKKKTAANAAAVIPA